MAQADEAGTQDYPAMPVLLPTCHVSDSPLFLLPYLVPSVLWHGTPFLLPLLFLLLLVFPFFLVFLVVFFSLFRVPTFVPLVPFVPPALPGLLVLLVLFLGFHLYGVLD